MGRAKRYNAMLADGCVMRNQSNYKPKSTAFLKKTKQTKTNIPVLAVELMYFSYYHYVSADTDSQLGAFHTSFLTV